MGLVKQGKTTLLKQLKYHRFISFADRRWRQRYERSPEVLMEEADSLHEEEVPLWIIDEVQKVPGNYGLCPRAN